MNPFEPPLGHNSGGPRRYLRGRWRFVARATLVVWVVVPVLVTSGVVGVVALSRFGVGENDTLYGGLVALFSVLVGWMGCWSQTGPRVASVRWAVLAALGCAWILAVVATCGAPLSPLFNVEPVNFPFVIGSSITAWVGSVAIRAALALAAGGVSAGLDLQLLRARWNRGLPFALLTQTVLSLPGAGILALHLLLAYVIATDTAPSVTDPELAANVSAGFMVAIGVACLYTRIGIGMLVAGLHAALIRAWWDAEAGP
jgi:hypothetical protein